MTKTELALLARAVMATSRDMAECARANRTYKNAVRSIAKSTGRTYDQVDAELTAQAVADMLAGK